MKISDVVNQIRLVLPNYTDYFGDVVSIDSIIASGGVATITTSSAHGLLTGSSVTLAGVETRTPISSFVKSGLNFTFTTGADHDLTFGWPENQTIELGGFTDPNWNTTFDLKDVANRRSFKVMSANSDPVLNGNEYLIEPNRIDGVNGRYSATVTGSNTFTISGGFIDGTYTPINGKVVQNVRAASVVDVDRAIEQYTEQPQNDFFIFVEPVNVEVSKDRSTYSDATATIGSGQEMRTRLIDGFTVYIFAPTSQEIAGADALDICRHDLLLPFMRTLYGVKFDTGLSVSQADYRTILKSHGVAAYNAAYLVYSYEFEVVYDLTDGDTVLPTATRAFRDIDYTLSRGGDDTQNMTIIPIDLDDTPL